MAQLPADRTKLNAAVANQQPSIVASAKANREALIEAYDTIDLLNQKVDTAISNGKMGNEIASDVDMKGYSLINANNVAAKSANIDAPNNGGFARIGIKNIAQVLDLAAYWEAGITQFAQVQSWDIVDNAPRLLRLNPLGGTVSINDYEAWHKGNLPYETGTWTPTLQGGSSGPSNNTYAYRFGRYVRMGNIVHVWCRVELSAKDTNMAGPLFLTGLPFTSDAGDYSATIAWTGYINLGTGTYLTARFDGGNAVVTFWKNGSSMGPSALSVSEIRDNTQIAVSGVYKIA